MRIAVPYPTRRSCSAASSLYRVAVPPGSFPPQTPAEADHFIELMRDSGEMRWHVSHEPGATIRGVSLGFHYYQAGRRLPDGSPWSSFEFSVPWWPLIALSMVLPGWWFVRRRQQRRMARLGLCPNCGYDLRATPGRCPECGTVVPSST
jgi:hypothetical protein